MSKTLRIRHLLTIAVTLAVVTVGGVLQGTFARQQQDALEQAIVEHNRALLSVEVPGRPAGPVTDGAARDALHAAAARGRRALVLTDLLTGATALALLGIFLGLLRPGALSVARHMRSREEEIESLQRSIASRSRLLARVSKQLRTPMNGVIGMAELLQAGELSRTQKEYARLIDLAARELLGVVMDVNAWVRMESTEEPIYKGPVAVGSLLDVVISDHLPSARAKGLDLVGKVSVQLPPRIITDEHVVAQVLNNLVSNAVRYTPTGAVQVQVDGDRSELRFTVVDTGPGMSPEQVVRAMSRDHVGALDGRDDGAIGIGLLICRHQAERLGGRLAIDSQLGVGSRITLHVPLEVPVDVQRTPEAGFRGMRALVIAPLPLQRRYLKDTLEGWGMLVETEQDPLRALGRIREAGTGQAPLELAVISQDLPMMSGLELGLRADMAGAAREIPMVLLDGQGEPMPATEALAAGFSAVVPHPWKPRRLRAAAELAVSGGEAGAAHEGRSAELTQRVLPAAAVTERVLVADGNPVNQTVLRAQLERIGLRAVAVASSDAAIAAGMERTWAAVFLDAGLAGGSGVDTARALRRRLGELCPPIILVVSDDTTSVGAARDAGASAVLARPFTRGQLEATVQRCIHEESSSSLVRTA